MLLKTNPTMTSTATPIITHRARRAPGIIG
jgi:hypothetical protein